MSEMTKIDKLVKARLDWQKSRKLPPKSRDPMREVRKLLSLSRDGSKPLPDTKFLPMLPYKSTALESEVDALTSTTAAVPELDAITDENKPAEGVAAGRGAEVVPPENIWDAQPKVETPHIDDSVHSTDPTSQSHPPLQPDLNSLQPTPSVTAPSTTEADSITLTSDITPPAEAEIDPLTSRFAHTTHLTIETHPDCFDLPPVHMPNLHTLRVRPQPGRAACVELCWSRESWPAKRMCTCAIVTHLRPPKLILGSALTGLCGHASGLWGAGGAPFPPPFVKEIVFYVGSDVVYEEPTFLANLPASLDRFTLVLEPDVSLGSNFWNRTASGHPHTSAFFDEMASPCSGDAKVVEVAGMEIMCKGWTGKDWTLEAAKQEIRDRAKARLIRRGVEEAEAGERAERIHFITKSEFLERERKEERRWST